MPVQLLLLHFRKYQLLLVFWLILVSTILGHFASHFGSASLFLSPEYQGKINFISMFLLGGAMALFMMSWHITTFIIHAHRVPSMGAIHQAFLTYCINNSAIPLAFMIFYSYVSIKYQWVNENADAKTILLLHIGFYLGFILIVIISFIYFFRTGRDVIKAVLGRIANPARIREIVPYDTLDYDAHLIRVDSFISDKLNVQHSSTLEMYDRRVLDTILRRHHRNVILATLFSYTLLILLGVFMNQPMLRIPAGAGFLIFFAILMSLVAGMKYFLRSWEIMGWVLIFLFISWLVFHRVFDLRSIAYGIDYHTSAKNEPKYYYDSLRTLFTADRWQQDKKTEEGRLNNWKKRTGSDNPPLIVVMVSGGGLRAAYWTFRTLQYADSVTKGKVFKNTVLIDGASGGMIGATYWRDIQIAHQDGRLQNPNDKRYLDNVSKDLLNAIIFSFVSVDLISPFNKITLSGNSYTKDRGYAMEQEMISNTEGLLKNKLGDFKEPEASGIIPQLIICGTITNDGRKLMIGAQPISYLTRAEFTLADTTPSIDAIDFAAFFAKQKPYDLRMTSALRMNATFPYILPVVRLPSQPEMNIMDAGLRDNFGMEITSRYLYVMRDWMIQNTRDVIVLQIRDTRAVEIISQSAQTDLTSMLSDPMFTIQEKWETFQSYYHDYVKDYAPDYLRNKLHFLNIEYIPKEREKTAELNFHLNQKEKEDLYNSIYKAQNQQMIDTLLQLLR